MRMGGMLFLCPDNGGFGVFGGQLHFHGSDVDGYIGNVVKAKPQIVDAMLDMVDDGFHKLVIGRS